MALADREFEPFTFNITDAREWLIPSIKQVRAMVAVDWGRTINERYREAGYTLAMLLMSNGETRQVHFVQEETPFTAAMDIIFQQEANGSIHEGSFQNALDSIGAGTFRERWGQYLGIQN